MRLETTPQPLFLEIDKPIKLIDLSTKFCAATTANFERNTEVGKETTSTAATAWFRYHNPSAFYTSTKTFYETAFKTAASLLRRQTHKTFIF